MYCLLLCSKKFFLTSVIRRPLFHLHQAIGERLPLAGTAPAPLSLGAPYWLGFRNCLGQRDTQPATIGGSGEGSTEAAPSVVAQDTGLRSIPAANLSRKITV